MQDEVNKSIKECDNAKTEYLARKDQLDKEKDKIIKKYKEECYKQLEALSLIHIYSLESCFR